MNKNESHSPKRKGLFLFPILLLPILYFLFTTVFPSANDSGLREETPSYHIVKEGDTLESIGLEYDLSLDTISWSNKGLDLKNLETGDRVEIPPMDGVLVTVQEGDTVESLASEYSGDAQEIADFNWLDYPYDLEVGSEIFIPYGMISE